MYMKKYVIISACIICLIVAAATFFIMDDQIYEEKFEEIRVPALEGFLENGLKYMFFDEPFNFDEFRREYNFPTRVEIEGTVIAETLSEAVRMGIQYIPGFYDMEPDRIARWGIVVSYCSSTDNWVLMQFLREGFLAGVPGVLAINRTDGSMAMYYFGW